MNKETMEDEKPKDMPALPSAEEGNFIDRFERDFRSSQISHRSRLSTTQFGVLLPQLGEASRILEYRDELQSHLKDVREARLNDQDETEIRKVSSEESMLNQVLQWISLDEEG